MPKTTRDDIPKVQAAKQHDDSANLLIATEATKPDVAAWRQQIAAEIAAESEEQARREVAGAAKQAALIAEVTRRNDEVAEAPRLEALLGHSEEMRARLHDPDHFDSKLEPRRLTPDEMRMALADADAEVDRWQDGSLCVAKPQEGVAVPQDQHPAAAAFRTPGPPPEAWSLSDGANIATIKLPALSARGGEAERNGVAQVAAESPVGLVMASREQKTKHGRRRDHLWPVIEKAQEACADPYDVPSVWAQLLVLAEAKVAPLFGATEEGIQFHKYGVAHVLTRRAVAGRLGRRRRDDIN